MSEQTRHTSDLYVRTSWIDAGLALSQIDKVIFTFSSVLTTPMCVLVYDSG